MAMRKIYSPEGWIPGKYLIILTKNILNLWGNPPENYKESMQARLYRPMIVKKIPYIYILYLSIICKNFHMLEHDFCTKENTKEHDLEHDFCTERSIKTIRFTARFLHEGNVKIIRARFLHGGEHQQARSKIRFLHGGNYQRTRSRARFFTKIAQNIWKGLGLLSNNFLGTFWGLTKHNPHLFHIKN